MLAGHEQVVAQGTTPGYYDSTEVCLRSSDVPSLASNNVFLMAKTCVSQAAVYLCVEDGEGSEVKISIKFANVSSARQLKSRTVVSSPAIEVMQGIWSYTPLLLDGRNAQTALQPKFVLPYAPTSLRQAYYIRTQTRL